MPDVLREVANQGLVFLCYLGQVFSLFFCVSGICSVLVPCFWLSVPVQLKMTDYLSSYSLTQCGHSEEGY